VFASADQVQMDRAKSAGYVQGSDRVFATNRLVMITPATNPGNVTSIADLGRAGVKLVTSQEEVPIGAYTQTMFERMSRDPQFGPDFAAHAGANIVSREADVRQIVAKVQLGEADVGVVYKTDVTQRLTSQIRLIDVPEAFNTTATYPIAKIRSGSNPEGAASFVGFVFSPAGQAILRKWNFSPAGEA